MSNNTEVTMNHQIELFILEMAGKINTGKVAHSVPSSPVVKNIQINPFLHRTPIPSTKKEIPKWVKGAPTPIQEG